jgi:hypothetical protein
MDQSSEASAFGRLGGSAQVPKGLAKLSKKRRSEIARKGVAARRSARASASEPTNLDDRAGESQEAALLTEMPSTTYAAKIGRLGGLKGGKARADALSPRKRSAIARKAALARWGK